MVLVPAAMSLLGHRAWWLPASLARVLPTIDLEGGDHHADREVAEEELDRDPALV
jgi:RND superfamily putative drug exporter